MKTDEQKIREVEDALDGVRQIYRKSMDKYAKDTMHMSMTVKSHPGYQAILNLGDRAIPCLVEDIRFNRNCFWGQCSLLFAIVGAEAPEVPEKSRGRLEHLRQIWLNWADIQGY